MKGILESIPEFFQIIVAIVLCILLFTLLFQFWKSFSQTGEITVSGNKDQVSTDLAKYIQDCWRDNREGLGPESAVCKIISVKSSQKFSELDVAKKLDCNFLPDNDCSPDDCSFCKSQRYDQQDRLIWNVTNRQTKIKISYSGADRVIYVDELIEGECKYTPLINCGSHTIAAEVNSKIVLLADFTQINDCCTTESNNILTFLKNTAVYLGGKKILIVYETKASDPNLSSHKQILDTLSSNGFEVSSFQHTQTLTSQLIGQADQLWILRPGWCTESNPQCPDYKSWTSEDSDAIANFYKKGGKIFLVSDYYPDTPQGVANDILGKIGTDAIFEETCACGCGGVSQDADKIFQHDTTKDMNGYLIKASTELGCTGVGGEEGTTTTTKMQTTKTTTKSSSSTTKTSISTATTTTTTTTTTAQPNMLTADNLIDCINSKGGKFYYTTYCPWCARQKQLFTQASPPAGPATKWDSLNKQTSGNPCGAVPCWSYGNSHWASCYKLTELNSKYNCGLNPISGYTYASCV